VGDRDEKEGGGKPIVGSYSSTNRDRINDIVSADFPTPPSPRTWILITLSSSTIVSFVPVLFLRSSLRGGEKPLLRMAG
jgi:hypothetical protein